MRFGTNLQFIRRQRGMTQEELAAKLGVSRQAVSKWESDGALPELEKLAALCELFGCTMDGLLRGDLAAACAVDQAGYDAHWNRFARQVAGGVAVLILGAALSAWLDGLALLHRLPDVCAGVAFMLCVIAGVSLLILGGLEHDAFVRRNPCIEPFYPQDVLDAFEMRFRRCIVGGVALILAAMTLMLALGEAAEAPGSAAAENFLGAVFLAITAVGVTVLIWAGLQKSKYDIPAYNRAHDPAPEAAARRGRADRLCTCIMLLATAVFLVLGLWKDLWRVAVLAFPVGGLLCAVVAVLLDRDDAP